jgi:hypothetical protein
LIEGELNGKISIQHLFDLVVGKGYITYRSLKTELTSVRASSIIALHLANDRWASGSCSIHLEKILRGGFDRSLIKSMPTISRRHGFFSRHRYHSKGLQAALKTAFTERRTLFDTPDGQGAALKAAIVAGTGGRPIVFTNYRQSTPPKRKSFVTACNIWTLRQCVSSIVPYDVHWPDDLAYELKAWEVYVFSSV